MSPDLLRMGEVWGPRLILQDGNSEFRRFLCSDGNSGRQATATTPWLEGSYLPSRPADRVFGQHPAWGAKSPQVNLTGVRG